MNKLILFILTLFCLLPFTFSQNPLYLSFNLSDYGITSTFIVNSLITQFQISLTELYSQIKNINYFSNSISFHLLDKGIITINNENYNYQLFTDHFRILRQSGAAPLLLTKYPLLMISKGDYGIKDVLSFSYKITQPNTNLVDFLYNREQILTNRNFGFVIASPLNKIFFIGAKDNEYTYYNPFKTTCNVIPHKNGWNCQLKAVMINNNTLLSNDEVSFTLNNHTTFVPKQYYSIIMNIVKHSKDSNSSITYKCDELITALPKIGFVFGNGVTWIDHATYVFNIRKNKCMLLLQESPHSSKWIIGHFILNSLGIKFDYDESTITFFSKHDNNNNNITFDNYYYKTTIKQRIFIIIIFILFIYIIIYLLFIKHIIININ